ncbi:MAG: hypothetical protein AB7I19_05280 [Planctomycetota bacterium]
MRVVLFTAGVLLLLAAVSIPTRASADPWDMARSIVRPFVLPGLLTALDDAAVRRDPGEMAARLRVIAELWPEWTDGTVDAAWRHALELGRESSDADQFATRLWEAERWLAGAAEDRGSRRPEAAVDFLVAAGVILTIAADQHPETETAYATLTGRTASERAAELIERALAIANDPAIALHAGHAATRAIAGAIRRGDLAQGEHVRNAAMSRFRALAGNDTAVRALHALERLPPLAELAVDPERVRAIAADPDLAPIAEAFASTTQR